MAVRNMNAQIDKEKCIGQVTERYTIGTQNN